jgi:Tol biopolymer transport system component
MAYSTYNAKSQKWELMLITLSKSGWEISSLNTEGLFPSWQPVAGSETIVFEKPRGRAPELYGLWTVSADGKQLVEIVTSTSFGAVTPAWSRDGKWIVFSSVSADTATDGRAGNLWVVGADGKSLGKISEGTAPEYSPACAPDGTIYFTTLRNGVKNIWSLVPDYGNDEEMKDKGLTPSREDVTALERSSISPGVE